MSSLDYVVLIGYLGATLLVGVAFAKRNRSVKDMFAAGGQSPWWVTGLSSFMTMFSAGTFVVWGGIAYKFGVVAIAINMTFGIAALAAGYLVAARWNASGVRTPAEFITLRFGKTATQFYAWVMISYRVVDVSITLYAVAVVLAAVMPVDVGNALRDPATGKISVSILIVGIGSIIVIYTMIGGLWAVLMTDVLQFVILNLSVLYVLFLTLSGVSSFGALTDAAPVGFFLPTGGGYGFMFLAGWCATQFFIIGADWAFAQRFLTVRSPRDATKSAYLFGLLYLISPLIWMSPPIIFRLTHPGANPEEAYILSGKAVLPPGMIGLMIAAMFSATASTVSGYLNVFAGVLTNDVYRPSFRRHASERELVLAGRVFSAGIGLLLVAFAMGVPSFGGAEHLVILLATLIVGPLMAPTIFGLLSPRIGSGAVWVTVSLSVLTGVVLKSLGSEAAAGIHVPVLSGLAQWSRESAGTVDTLIGVVLPVAVLTVAHFVGSGENKGWLNVGRRAAESERAQSTTVVEDTIPARTLAVALIVSGLSITALAPFDVGYRVSLCTFGSAVAVLGFAVLTAVRRGIPARAECPPNARDARPARNR